MKIDSARTAVAPLVIATLCLLGSMRPAVAAASLSATPGSQPPAGIQSVDLFVTNHVWRFITNVIEVRMPMNLFRDVYQTNWVEQHQTNVIEVYRTNRVEKTLTNTTVVQMTQTNWVTAYQTNLTSLTLTNWENVLVLQTNWVTQPMTNTVQIDLPVPAPAPAAVAANPETAPATPPAEQPNDLRIELSRTARPATNNQVEVQLTVKSVSDPAAILQVQEWRLERGDGTVLIYGPRPQFTTDLPVGVYKVIVKARRSENSRLITVRDTMEITQNGSIRVPIAVLSIVK